MIYTYYSSTDCVISVGSSPAPEIYSIQFGEQESVMPIYGWRDRFYSTIGSGNVLVSGTIIYNARYPNYLEQLAEGSELGSYDSKTTKAITEIQQKVTDAIDNSEITSKTLVPILELARMRARYDGAESSVDLAEYSALHKARKNPFTILIAGPVVVDVLVGCRLTGRATEVNGGEANNIKYAQAFIGKMATQSVPSGADATTLLRTSIV